MPSADKDPHKHGGLRFHLREVHVIIDGHGRFSIRVRHVVDVLTRQGMESVNRLAQSHWSPWYQSKPELTAVVTNPDGAKHKLDPATVAVHPARQSHPGLVNNSKVVKAPLPGLTVGSRVDVTSYREKVRPLVRSGGLIAVGLVHVRPLTRSRITVDMPVDSGFSIKLAGASLKPRVDEVRGGRRVVVYESGPFEPIKHWEPYAPPNRSHYPAVLINTAASWSSVARDYHEVVERQLRGASLQEMTRKALAGASGAGTRQKAALLLREVQRRVRYSGVHFNDAAIVPRRPADTLSRSYGDCKDKSALLVGLLRAAGIPANVALIKAGYDFDVSPGSPGLELFNHAIVHVPGNPELWVDPTQRYARVGEVPLNLAGRWALVAAPGTQDLARLPRATAAENTLEEERHVRLASLGPGQVEERVKATGSIERSLRHRLGHGGKKKWSKSMERYMKSFYGAKALHSFKAGDPDDLGRSFSYRLTGKRAKQVITSVNDAGIVMDFTSALSWLPRTLTRAPPEKKEDRRKAPLVMRLPHQVVLRYVVEAPAGFELKEKPKDMSVQLGPATLSLTFTERASAFTAEARLASGPRVYSPAQVREFRESFAGVRKRLILAAAFEQRGFKLVQKGKVRQGLDLLRKEAARTPVEEVARIRLAVGYLTAGFGAPARAEARAAAGKGATEVAFRFLGWILEHDLLGRRLSPGFDRKGAVAAYRQALKMDPERYETRAYLAIMLEYNDIGWRYGPGSDLSGAIAHYEHLRLKLKRKDLNDNLLVALLRDGQHGRVLKLLKEIKSAHKLVLEVAAIGAQKGVKAALAHARAGIQDDGRRRATLLRAAGELFKCRRYGVAVKLRGEGLSDAAKLTSRRTLRILSAVKRTEQLNLQKATPINVARRLMADMILGRLDRARFKAKYAHIRMRDETQRQALKVLRGIQRRATAKWTSGDTSVHVLGDMFASWPEVTSQGDERAGYRILYNNVMANGGALEIFVMRQGRGYRVRALGLLGLGDEAYYQVRRGNLQAARTQLEWAKSMVHRVSASRPFLHLWQGRATPRWRMRLAAGIIVSSKGQIKSVIRDVRATLRGKRRMSPETRLQLRFALMSALNEAEQWKEMLKEAGPLVRRGARPERVLWARVHALSRLKRHKKAAAAVKAWLKTHPHEASAHSFLARRAAVEGRVAEAEQRLKELNNHPRQASIYNELAWHELARNPKSTRAVGFAEKAAQLTGYNHASKLDTLAVAYAHAGRLGDARRTWLKGMALSGHPVPELHDWYPMGLMAEGAGLPAVARWAYSQVTPPDPVLENCSYLLARKRLKALKP